MDLHSLNERITEIFRGRKWILCAEMTAGATAVVRALSDRGADDVLVIGGSPGIGDQPPDDKLAWAETEPTDTMMGGIREYLSKIDNPVPSVIASVEKFDPQGDALVLIPDFHHAEQIAGRRVYGSRSRDIEALEDKTTVDALWDDVGVERAAYEIVAVSEAPHAAARLGGPLGSVWSADSTLGWHGGGGYTRWVGPDDDMDALVEWFSDAASTVRVMPFLDGIPCSIRGFVGTTGIAVFRPCEVPGPSIAPMGVALLEFVRGLWGLDAGPHRGGAEPAAVELEQAAQLTVSPSIDSRIRSA